MIDKNEWPKELVYLDLTRETFKFFNIELTKIKNDLYQVTFHSGKYGNKGSNKVERFAGVGAYKEARKFAYKKFYELRSTGFVAKIKMDRAILKLIKEEQQKSTQNKAAVKTKRKVCDECGTEIAETLYAKINAWGRKEGNWDYSKESPYFKKVVCLNCQIDKGIFQKRLEDSTEEAPTNEEN